MHRPRHTRHYIDTQNLAIRNLSDRISNILNNRTFTLPVYADGDHPDDRLDGQMYVNELGEVFFFMEQTTSRPNYIHVIGAVGEPAFQNAWINFGEGFAPASFRKDLAGTVHIEGTVKSGAVGPNTAIFTLPTYARPTYNHAFAIQSGSAFGRINVFSSGVVACGVGSNTDVSLDGVSFYAGER